MFMSVTGLDSHSSANEIKIEHNNDILSFNVSTFSRKAFENFDMFSQINELWSTYNAEKQNKIFKLYREIRFSFDEIYDRNSLNAFLFEKVGALLNLHEFDATNDWVLIKSGIIFPPNFETHYVPSIERQGTREQTYIRSDYTKLITLSLILRTVIPIWGEFISRTRQENGNNFKEIYALHLISRADLYNGEAMEKLRIYINATIGNNNNNTNSILEGISSEDFPTYILALVLIRRLCIGDIRGVESTANLVTLIYKHVTQKINNVDTVGSNIIKDKTIDESGPESEKTSALEKYKVKQDLSGGQKAELEFSISSPIELAFKLSSSMKMEYIEDALETSKILLQKGISKPNVDLTRWVLRPVIVPRGLVYVSKEAVLNAIAVTQAVLWSKGYKALALLVSSYHDNSSGINISGVDSRARIPKELQDELNRLYPYFKRTGSKQKQIKPVNLALNAIDRIVDEFSEGAWVMSANPKLIAEHFGSDTVRRFQIPHDIKVLIANLVVDIGNRHL